MSAQLKPSFRLTAPCALEREEQAALFRYAALQSRRDSRWSLLNSSQNGMRTTPAQARWAKACGMRKGFPDISLPVPSHGYHGLFIELKRRGATECAVRPEQREWLAQLAGQGYAAQVAYGWEHAIEVISAYLAGTLTPANSPKTAHDAI